MRFCPRCGASLNEQARFCPACGSGLSAETLTAPTPMGWQPPVRWRSPSRAYRPDDLHRPAQRAIGSILAAFGLTIAVGVTSAVLGVSGLAVLFGLGAAGAVVFGLVSWYVFLYRAWDQAQAFTGRTTPGQAVGLLFVPFFNLYWSFVAYLELAKAMNRELQRTGTPRPAVSEGLTIAACVLQIVVAVPLIGIFAIIPAAIVDLVLAVQFRKAAVAIAERGPVTV